MDFILPKLYYLTMKVAITIPTLNRPDFVLRQFELYELMNSPHPMYILDSSNEENAEKLKEGIKKFKKLSIVYEWVPPGKDHTYSLLPLVKEKYCIQMGDDDLIIPKTISDCADFLESHSDYATCGGKQVNIRLRLEDYDKPRGIIGTQTMPFGRSIEHEDMFARVRNFWSNPTFICFTVRRTEIERKIRNITKHFSLLDYATEFLIWSALIIYGKAKVLDELGYIMQLGNRYGWVDYSDIEWFMSSPVSTAEKWKTMQNGLSEILQECGRSEEENPKIFRWVFTLYLIHQFTSEIDSPAVFPFLTQKQSISFKRNLSKKIRYFASSYPLFKKIYYQFKTPQDATRPESKYFNDFKVVKDFIENSRV